MKAKSIFWFVLGLAALIGFTSYVAFGETGPIGWINAAQAAMFGSYSRRLSATVLMAAVCIPIVAVWSLVAPRSLQQNARKVSAAIETPLGPPPNGKTLAGRMLLAWLGCVALVWAAIYGHALWQRHTQASDAVAAYVPLELTAGMKDPAAGRDHLALRGRLLGDHLVSRKKGSDGSEAMTLVPVVERGWKEGDPVHFVLRFGAQGEAALRSALQQPAESLLVRTDGAVPTLARSVFERTRAPLADDALALVPVAAEGGRPVAPPEAGSEVDVATWGALGTGLVTVLFAMIGAALVGSARQARKQAARAGR